jgi:uncharacterized protein YjeT (DUF2065 family)
MTISALLLSFALMLIIEGLVPLGAPAFWRKMFARLVQFSDGQIRFMGLSSLLLGSILFLWLV